MKQMFLSFLFLPIPFLVFLTGDFPITNYENSFILNEKLNEEIDFSCSGGSFGSISSSQNFSDCNTCSSTCPCPGDTGCAGISITANVNGAGSCFVVTPTNGNFDFGTYNSYICSVTVISETEVYVKFDVNQIVCDGKSLSIPVTYTFDYECDSVSCTNGQLNGTASMVVC